MKKEFEILKQAYHLRKLFKQCKRLAPESEAYKLGKYFKDEIEQLEDSDVSGDKINQLIQNANERMVTSEETELMNEMLSSVVIFLTTLKRSDQTKH